MSEEKQDYSKISHLEKSRILENIDCFGKEQLREILAGVLTEQLQGIKTNLEPEHHAGWMAEGKPDPFNGRYDAPTRAEAGIGAPHVTDYQVAGEYYMASRDSLDLIHHQTVAKERIRWLSRQLYLSQQQQPVAAHNREIKGLYIKGAYVKSEDLTREVLDEVLAKGCLSERHTVFAKSLREQLG